MSLLCHHSAALWAEIRVFCACKALKRRKNSPSFLQVLDPYQDQDEESAVVVVEESEKKIKSEQDMVIDVALLVPNNFQTFSI